MLLGTAIVAACVSLNGDGTTTTLICCTAFIPIYKKLHLKMMNLGVLIILMNTIMNLLPWGGPTARVISVLQGQPGVDEQTILRALIPGMLVSIVYMLGVAVYLGMKERKRVGIQTLSAEELAALTATDPSEGSDLKRPQYVWINAIMTIAIVVMLVLGTFPSMFLFLVGTGLALMINYRSIKEQKARISENAGDALQVVILVFAAGIFMGLFTNSGMSDALANSSLIKLIPPSAGRLLGSHHRHRLGARYLPAVQRRLLLWRAARLCRGRLLPTVSLPWRSAPPLCWARPSTCSAPWWPSSTCCST